MPVRTVCRVLIAAHYASERLGGEGAIPVRLFAGLRERDLDVWLVTHVSGREELSALFPAADDRIVYVPSLPGMTPVFTRGEALNDGFRALAWAVTQLERQAAMLPIIRSLVAEHHIDVVHAPIGVAPSVPSPLRRLGAPMVVGPLNGGMSLPPAMRAREDAGRKVTEPIRSLATRTAHRVMSGRREADLVLVANERTRALLPNGLAHRDRPVQSEIGVDLASWPDPKVHHDDSGPVTLLFAGRLVELKGVDLLLEALAGCAEVDVRLQIVGDGPSAADLTELAARLGVADRVDFLGWRPHDETAALMRAADVFVFPSLREAGGTVVLEGMACGLPVIVADWGGPAEMVDETVGIKVPVDDRDELVAALRDAIIRLARDTELRARLGRAGRDRVATTYDWSVLLDRLVAAYDSVLVGLGSGEPERSG